MTALAADRNTPEMAMSYRQLVQAAEGADSTQFYAGGLVVLDQADGKVKKGGIATTYIALGRCEENLLTGTSNTRQPRIKCGCFRWGNSAAGDAIAADDIGKACYIVDDQTVALTSNTSTRSVAGTIVAVDSSGVWVGTNPVSGGLAAPIS